MPAHRILCNRTASDYRGARCARLHHVAELAERRLDPVTANRAVPLDSPRGMKRIAVHNAVARFSNHDCLVHEPQIQPREQEAKLETRTFS